MNKMGKEDHLKALLTFACVVIIACNAELRLKKYRKSLIPGEIWPQLFKEPHSAKLAGMSLTGKRDSFHKNQSVYVYHTHI